MKTRKRKRKVQDKTPDESQIKMEAFLNHTASVKPPPNARRTKTLSGPEQAIYDARSRAETGEWDGATGKTFVGLYAVCHEMVYGVLPILEPKDFGMASRHALRCLQTYFDGDPDEMVDFVRWIWDREEGREKWAAANNISRSRISVMFQFSSKLVSDYRVEAVRQTRRRR